MTEINNKTDGSCGYIAFYNGKKIGVYANSSYQAKCLAEDYFKPPKSKKHLVTVFICEKDGKEMFHNTDF